MVSVSCSTKLHAFALSEQLERHGLLGDLYTSYAYQKNTFLNRFVKRVDKENIPVSKIRTNTLLAFPIKLLPGYSHGWNGLFDKWVASQLTRSDSTVFIGWSGMSLNSMRAAKKAGMVTVVERGSSHIVYQNAILQEEYKKFNIDFKIHPTVIETELQEYEEADYISIPSYFVKKTFIAHGVNERKLIMNPYGAGTAFSVKSNVVNEKKATFTIVYLGTLSILKGLVYLFEALHQLDIPDDAIEVWFIGAIKDELKPVIEQYKKKNWKFFGHINHYELSEYLSQCDVGVQPSIAEGLSMVIPQYMACGLPVIVTDNSGGENVVTEGVNGFIVPIREPRAIADKITLLYSDQNKLKEMKNAAAASIIRGLSWNDYGNRYVNFLTSLHSR